MTTARPSLRELLEQTLSLHWAGTRGETTAYTNAKGVISILGPALDPAEVTSAAIQGLITKLKARGNSPATINRKLAALSKVLSVAVDGGHLEQRPKLPRLKEKEGRTRFLSPDEERRLFDAMKGRGDDVRDFCIFLVETGVRVGEALRLRWLDVHDLTVHIRGTKADSPRAIPLTLAAQEVLLRQAGKEKPWGHISHNRLQYIWRLAKDEAGFADDPEVVPHVLRHTCASRLVQSGVGITIVQKWLGHRMLTQTMRYAHLAVDQLDEAKEALENLRKSQ